MRGSGVVDDQRNAPEDTVSVGDGVEKSRPAGGPRQLGQAADGAVGVKERIRVAGLRLDDGNRKGMEHAVPAATPRVPEGERISQHHAAVEQRAGQGLVSRGGQA